MHPRRTSRAALRSSAALAAALALACQLSAQQATPPAEQPQADVTPGAIHTAPRTEPPVSGFVRKTRDAIALLLPNADGQSKTLLLHDFDFNGDPVDTSKLHLKLISPGVYEIESLAYDVGYWRFYVEDAASYYGFGEHFDTLDRAHAIVKNLSSDTPGVKGSSTYKPIPFFLSTTGYGLWVDTTGEATFDLNVSDRNQIVVDAVSNRLRIRLFTGETEKSKADAGKFPAILAAFTSLACGDQPAAILPPYWAFAPWQSRDFHSSEAEVREDVDRTRELGLPASVIVLDSPWATAYNSYIFNPKQFDDPAGMVKHLHESGYKLVLWHTSWINNKSGPPSEPGFEGKIAETSPNYAVAADRGFFVKNQNGTPWVGGWWKGQGSLIDFTNPRAKQWWQDQLRLAIAAGADGFKDDDAEGSYITPDLKFSDGTDPRLMRNRYATLYNQAVEEVIQKDLKGNGVISARSVTTGANNLGFLWAGDNEASFSPSNGLPTVLTAALSAGLSGMPLWTADLGGYEKLPDTPNATLLERWTEFAAFSPVMQIHSQANITPWPFDKNSPSGTPALDTYRKYAVLHMSLFPYRYAAAQQAALTGMPLMRALVLEYQDDPVARSIKDEYLFGPDLLVAPVLTQNTSRAVYLPAGDWLNLFTGDAFTGPRTIVAKAPLDTIPVYARKGTVLAKIPEDVMTLVPPDQSGNDKVHALDSRRVFEILGPAADADTTFTDFEGRAVTRSGNTLKISLPAEKPADQKEAKPDQKTDAAPAADSPSPDTKPNATPGKPEKPAHIILRWRFTTPHSVSVNGKATPMKSDKNGIPTVEFDLTSAATISWQ
jgi:alpha-D-xyloside xylohydrolase